MRNVLVEIQLNRCIDTPPEQHPTAEDKQSFAAPKDLAAEGAEKQPTSETPQEEKLVSAVQQSRSGATSDVPTPTWRSKRLAEKRRAAADSRSDTESISRKSSGSDGNVSRRKLKKSAEEGESKLTPIRRPVTSTPQGSEETSAAIKSKQISAKGIEKSSLPIGPAPAGRQLPASTAMEFDYEAEEGSDDDEMVRGADDDSDASFVEESDSEDDEEAPAMEFEFDEGPPAPAANQQPQSANVWNLHSRDGATSIPVRMVSIGAEVPRVDPDKKGILFKLGMEGSYRVNS